MIVPTINYYDNDEGLPVYEWLSSKSKRLYSPEQLFKIQSYSHLMCYVVKFQLVSLVV